METFKIQRLQFFAKSKLYKIAPDIFSMPLNHLKISIIFFKAHSAFRAFCAKYLLHLKNVYNLRTIKKLR